VTAMRVALAWKRCPDGVEEIVVEAPKRAVDGTVLGPGPGPRYRYKSKRRDSVLYQATSLDNPLIVQLCNARTPEHLLAFYSNYGLLWDGDDWPADISPVPVMTKYLRAVGSGNRAAALAVVNSKIQVIPFRFSYDIEAGQPVLTARTNSLEHFMFAEGMLIAEHGARLVECEHDRRLFLTGPLTGRRSHAKYCSDRCRVAAMRARNAIMV
jgi:hypothetical protein